MALEWLKIIFFAFLPVSELRWAVPYGIIIAKMPWLEVAVFAFLGNVLAVPAVFAFLEFLHKRFLHIGAYRTAFDRFMERTRVKAKPHIDRWGYLGLAVFVAVPLPFTGAYTGALAAWFFGMSKWKAFIAIAIGVAVACVIVTAAVLSGSTLLEIVFSRVVVK